MVLSIRYHVLMHVILVTCRIIMMILILMLFILDMYVILKNIRHLHVLIGLHVEFAEYNPKNLKIKHIF